jgi:hypothetical protein
MLARFVVFLKHCAPVQSSLGSSNLGIIAAKAAKPEIVKDETETPTQKGSHPVCPLFSLEQLSWLARSLNIVHVVAVLILLVIRAARVSTSVFSLALALAIY